MPAPALGEYFDSDDVCVAAFRALEAVLKADAILSRLPIYWQAWEGNVADSQPPSSNQLPFVRLTPVEFPLNLSSEHDFEGFFPVRIDFGVAGCHFNDLGNMAGAIRGALRKTATFRDTTVWKYFDSVGVNNYQLGRAGVGARRTEQPPADPAVASPIVVTDQFSSVIVTFSIFFPDIV